MSCDSVVVVQVDRQTVEVHSPGPMGSGLPPGGVAGDLVVKQSGTDGDAEWASALDQLNLTPDLDPNVTLQQGQMAWNTDDGTADLGLNGGAAILQIGQESMYRVQNNTGSTIPNGTLCMYAGTIGNSGKIRVKPWDGSGEGRLILGLATIDIPNGGLGYVTWFGSVRGIQTDGANYGETWADGDLIWADPAGGLTNVKPTAPAVKARIGAVVSAHSNNGTLFVRVRHGSSLGDDELVELGTPSDGDAPVWNSTTERFEMRGVVQSEAQFTGDGAEDTFDAGAGRVPLYVFVDGLKVRDFSVVGSSVVFNSAPTLNAEIDVICVSN